MFKLFKKKKVLVKTTSRQDELVSTMQKTWDNFGQKDPYFSVLTDPKYHGEEIPKEVLKDFYFSDYSKRPSNYLFETLKSLGFTDEKLKEMNILDFGCGVGRNAVHLAKKFKEVLGLDISAEHLKKAAAYVQSQGFENCKFLQSNMDLQKFGMFDVIFSVITIQHIPHPIAYSYMQQMLSMLKPNGYAFLHMPTYAKNYVYNEEKCLQKDDPLSWQMHFYPVHEMKALIKKSNCKLIKFDSSFDHCHDDRWVNGFFIIKKKA